MGIILIITSLLLNVYLFYKYIKERVDKVDYKWMYNRTQCDLDNARESLDKLSEINSELESIVTGMINRKSNRHENI